MIEFRLDLSGSSDKATLDELQQAFGDFVSGLQDKGIAVGGSLNGHDTLIGHQSGFSVSAADIRGILDRRAAKGRDNLERDLAELPKTRVSEATVGAAKADAEKFTGAVLGGDQDNGSPSGPKSRGKRERAAAKA